MKEHDEYGQPEGADDLAALCELTAQAFGATPAEATASVTVKGVENLRRVRRAGATIAGLALLPMAQFWGGRPVPLMGFANVASAPHVRGEGVAKRLMLTAMREARGAGFALSALYPSTQAFYRRLGFEQAGARYQLMARPDAFHGGERLLAVRPCIDADLPAVQALDAREARDRAGFLERGAIIWQRIREPRGSKAYGYVVDDAGQLAGYLFYSLIGPGPAERMQLKVLGWAASSPSAWRTLHRFVTDHASVVTQVSWFGGPDEPLLLLAREQSIQVRLSEYFMLRVLDVHAALRARGYPPCVAGELHLEITDASLPENAGRYVLRVEGGRAAVEHGGRGELQCEARALAVLYASHRSASELRRLGLLQAPASVLELADAAFGGRPGAMPDYF